MNFPTTTTISGLSLWQVGEEVGGMVMVRSADSRQGVCPIKFLQEV